MTGLSNVQRHELAASLGSDVPFFLRGGTAMARGTGTQIEALPALTRTWFVIVSPRVAIPNKTATRYHGLRADDFSAGDETEQIVARIRGRHPVHPEQMRNPFARALYAEPSIEAARRALFAAGASFVLPSGAGPSLFTIVESWEAACRLAARLRDEHLDVVACTNLSAGVNDARIARVELEGT
jgi:4-diphosphocytidyl-2-C-methyl-D-erythritol kinase